MIFFFLKFWFFFFNLQTVPGHRSEPGEPQVRDLGRADMAALNWWGAWIRLSKIIPARGGASLLWLRRFLQISIDRWLIYLSEVLDSWFGEWRQKIWDLVVPAVLVARERRSENFSSAWRHVDTLIAPIFVGIDRSMDELSNSGGYLLNWGW